MKKKDHGRYSGSLFMNTDRKRGLLCAVLLFSALFLALGFGTIHARAGSQQKARKTTVIRTGSEEEFSGEVSKLAKKNPGLSVQGTGKLRPYSSARLIVRIKDDRTVDFSTYHAVTVVQSNYGISVVQFASSNAAKKAAASLNALSSVVYVEPDDCGLDTGDMEIIDGNYPETENGQGNPSESGDDTPRTGSSTIGNLPSGEDLTFFTSLKVSSLSEAASSMSWGVSYIQADKYAAFVKANTKRSIKVAVVDTGVSSHTKLKGRLLAGRDFVDNDKNPSDKNGHGTHVAGTIVDCTPGINVFILPVRVMNASGMGNPSVVGNGIRYAVRKGAKVINLSLGGDSHYKYLEECIEYAYKKGVTVVVAAGNFCEDTKYTCPAHLSSPIVVGSINKKGSRSWFSNYGASVDVVAPGENIRSCWKNGGCVTASGTSMAAPHVSAVAAMYRLMNPSYNAAKIQKLVKSYTKDLGAKGTDRYYGRGVPRMSAGIAPSGVALSRTKASLEVKDTLTLTAKLFPSYAGRKALSWSSSNSSIVAVSKTGKLTAKRKGTATITVKTINGKKAVCKVTVTSAAAYRLSQTVAYGQKPPQGAVRSGTDTIPESASPGTETLPEKSLSRALSAGVRTAPVEPSPVSLQTVSMDFSSAGARTASMGALSVSSRTVPMELSSAGVRTDSGGSAPADLQTVPESASAAAVETGSSGTVSAAGTFGISGQPENTVDLSDQQEKNVSAEKNAIELTAVDTAPVKTVAAEKEESPAPSLKIYIFPSDRADNARLRDGTIVTGERLALDSEIVPSQKDESGTDPKLVWKSSDPEAAAVDENGIVTALSPGETELTAMPAAGDTGSSVTCKPLHIHVVAPSIMTRDVSYSADEDETEIEMHAVLRLPGGLSGGSPEMTDDSGGGEQPLNSSDGYVLAMFRKGDGKDLVLLGAADLNTGVDIPYHVHDPGTGRQITESSGLPEEIASLTSTDTGKQPTQAGILRLRKIREDSGKADASLLLDAGAAKAALQDPSGNADIQKEEGKDLNRTEWKCRLAVYRSPDFETLETACAEGDKEAVRETERKALCSCDFSLKMEIADSTEDPAKEAPGEAETREIDGE